MNKKTRHIFSAFQRILTSVPTAVLLVVCVSLFAITTLFLSSLIHTSAEKKSVSLDTFAKTFSATCKNATDWRSCYGKRVAAFNKKRQLEDSIGLIDEIQKKDDKVRDCHILAHYLSLSEVEKAPGKWEELLTKVSYNECSYGYIHGVIEGRARYDSRFVLDETTIPQICSVVIQKKTGEGLDQTCAHIIGHVLLAEKNADVAASIDVCERVPQALQYQCNGGVFMENFTRDNLVAHSVASRIPWNEDTIAKQEQLCFSYSGVAARGCWLEISHLYNAMDQWEPDKVYARCSRAPLTDFRNECYIHSVATLIFKENPNDSYYKKLCEVFTQNPSPFSHCMYTAIQVLINSSARFAPQAIQFCGVTPENHRNQCFSHVGQLLSTRTSQQEKFTICNAAPSEFRTVCKSTQ